eukprot:ANDGO_06274.mRNA.1 Cilia- and flagella-associated protein 52
MSLALSSCIGLSGTVPSGVHVISSASHASLGSFLVYPLGSTLVLKSSSLSPSAASSPTFLSGHSNRISVLAVSSCGRFAASGQVSHMGFAADIIIWALDYASASSNGAPQGHLLHRLSLHKVRVSALAFSDDSHFLVSLGGIDDRQIVVWDVMTGKALCGTHYGSEEQACAQWLSNGKDMRLVTGGTGGVKLWTVDLVARKMTAVDAQLGKMKRSVTCLAVSNDTDDADGGWVYAGTDAGDVLVISLKNAANPLGNGPLLRTCGPKERFSQGVSSIAYLAPNSVAIAPFTATTTATANATKLAGTKTLSTTVTPAMQKAAAAARASARPVLLVGGGDGSVAVLSISAQTAELAVLQKITVDGGVTSVAVAGSSVGERDMLWVGTTQSNLYALNLRMGVTDTVPSLASIPSSAPVSNATTSARKPATAPLPASAAAPVSTAVTPLLFHACHASRINDVSFPFGTGALFATCSSAGDVRIWNSKNGQELVRIAIPSVSANCVSFSRDGGAVLVGFGDGKLRAFGPQSGKLLWVIDDAHAVGVGAQKRGEKAATGPLTGVTAVAPCADGVHVVTGGSDGQIRVWSVNLSSSGNAVTKMAGSMKEHKGTINAIRVRRNDAECISASDDGSCIVWDLRRMIRSNILYAQTYFKDVALLDDESQIVTVGTDRKIGYWDAYDCSLIRELDGSPSGELLTGDLDSRGLRLATGGEDRAVRLWDYDAGEVIATGLGHSGAVTRVRFAPDCRTLVSVGDEGAVLVWNVPQ